jgi:dolichol kinase
MSNNGKDLLNPPPARTWRESVEWGRKAIHVSSTALAVWVLSVPDPWTTAGLAAATLFVMAVDLARLRMKRWALWFYRKFPLIFRRDERHDLSGASVMMIGATLASFLFPPAPAAAGILCLAWGDSAAAVVGQAVSFRRRQLGLERDDGTRAPVVIRRRGKTWVGTFACFAASTLVVALVLRGEPAIALTAGVTSAVMERWTPGRWDNLTIPLASAAAIQFCHTWLR